MEAPGAGGDRKPEFSGGAMRLKAVSRDKAQSFPAPKDCPPQGRVK
jgi:hypothetical protein